jgi:hypothetical protein
MIDHPETETWEDEAREGAYMIACAMGVRIEDVAAAVEEIPDGLPKEAPVSRLGELTGKSTLEVDIARPGGDPEGVQEWLEERRKEQSETRGEQGGEQR